MKATIELPDDLLRRAEATAAARGVALGELVAAFIKLGLDNLAGTRARMPVAVPAGGRTVPSFTNHQIEEILLEQDLRPLG